MSELFLIVLKALFLSHLSTSVYGGSIAEGGNCSISNNRLDSATHKFMSDCDDRTFCSASLDSPNSTASNEYGTAACIKKLCRQDEFPFGFEPGEPLPPLCDRGFYCPDEGDGCKAVLAAGAACELSRDVQCAPPPEWQSLASRENFNGSICLESKCMYANVTLGLSCIIESTLYTGFGSGVNGQPYSTTVVRDNCWSPLLYCEPSSMLCEKTYAVGQVCQVDRGCMSSNCGPANTCTDPPGTPVKVRPWQYALTTVSILGAMTSISTFLTLSHKRHRMARYYELQEYYHEQTSLRKSIIALHSAAAQRLADANEKAMNID